MANSAWRDKERPLPGDAGIHFGAQGGWEPEREGRKVRIDPETGRLSATGVLVCYLCHDGLTRAEMPELVVCGACGRWSADHLISAALAASPAPKRDSPAQLKDWEDLPTDRKYPDRRPNPRGKLSTPPWDPPAEEGAAGRSATDAYLYRVPAPA